MLDMPKAVDFSDSYVPINSSKPFINELFKLHNLNYLKNKQKNNLIYLF